MCCCFTGAIGAALPAWARLRNFWKSAEFVYYNATLSGIIFFKMLAACLFKKATADYADLDLTSITRGFFGILCQELLCVQIYIYIGYSSYKHNCNSIIFSVGIILLT